MKTLFLSDQELIAVPVGSPFIFDIECYINYFLVAFKHIESGKIVTFELDALNSLNSEKLRWMLFKFKLIGFNSNSYDIPVLLCALSGMNNFELKRVTNEIIVNSLRSYQIYNNYKLELPAINHIDLIEVCPLTASLKTYAGRLHCQKMQDLPYSPETVLTYEQAQNIKTYCINDLDNTLLIFNELKDQLTLREQMSTEYNIDLRSKSDAQIAEAVITQEIGKLKGFFPKKPVIKSGTQYYYNIPDFVKFLTPELQTVLEKIKKAIFVIDHTGSPKAPKDIEGLTVKINKTTYKLGMGGLHSTEKSIAHISDENTLLIDRDVESFYPRIILNQGLMPKHLGKEFLQVYEQIVNRRIEAKRAKNSVVADSLKITINGSFGKLGSKYSALYAPDLLLQVTISGQLCLLMLIEMIEYVGISVVSGNTDGIVIKCPKDRYDDLNKTIAYWESITNFKTEETQYKATYSKDVNNYIAVKEDGKCKSKGAYSNHWNDPKQAIFRFHKNPQTTVCSEAINNFIVCKESLDNTIKQCRDISKFVAVRNVKGGAIKSGEYLGKVIRWYYAKGEKGFIEYKSNGNKVPKSDGAKPLMNLPLEFPNDIDYDWYIKEATDMLYDIGYYKKQKIF